MELHFWVRSPVKTLGMSTAEGKCPVQAAWWWVGSGRISASVGKHWTIGSEMNLPGDGSWAEFWGGPLRATISLSVSVSLSLCLSLSVSLSISFSVGNVHHERQGRVPTAAQG